jgi:hypothetical protein
MAVRVTGVQFFNASSPFVEHAGTPKIRRAQYRNSPQRSGPKIFAFL